MFGISFLGAGFLFITPLISHPHVPMTPDALAPPVSSNTLVLPAVSTEPESPRTSSNTSVGAIWLNPVIDYTLVFMFLPLAALLIAVCALVVRLTSSGPAFYTQTRVGRNGRRFMILKLRTMRHGCEIVSGPRWSMPGDDRITTIGAFLRATHLDELPQLWNVLRGEMGLVGPRPERPEMIAAHELNQRIPEYSERLAVKPGLTGLAQLQLPPDTDIESVRRKVVYDLFYIRHCGPWLNIRLIIGAILKAAGVGPCTLRWLLILPTWAEVLEDAAAAGSSVQPTPLVRPTANAANVEKEANTTDWRTALSGILDQPQTRSESSFAEAFRPALRKWFRTTVSPALHELASELRRHGRRVQISVDHPEEAAMRVWNERGERELDLKFRARIAAGELRVYSRELVRDGKREFVHEYPVPHPLQWTRSAVIAYIIGRYRALLTACSADFAIKEPTHQ